jgi:hypothetical protein
LRERVPLAKIGILGWLRIVGIFPLFLGVQVIEIAEELVKPVDSGQELVAVAQGMSVTARLVSSLDAEVLG